jgi:hypothetical protein
MSWRPRRVRVTFRVMNKLWLAFALFSIASLALVTGCGPRWQVVKQAAPNPMVADSKFFVEKPDFDAARVGGKSDADYAAGKNPEQAASWQADKAAFMEEFGSGYTDARETVGVASAPGEGFVVKSHVTWIEPGFYAAVAARPTEVKMTVQVLDKGGVVQDEFLIHSAIPASMTNPSTGGRLRDAGKDLGHVVAKYMRKRTAVN